ncbi:MAG: hypothetical protein PUC88_04870 [Clostridia bacterium]|nr:hypothetical protein [Clostridia bacterium]
MKKKKWIPIVIIIVLVAILFTPIPTGVYKDGGTRVYSALTYKIVDWNRLGDINSKIYDKTKVYFFPNNFKSLDSLWYYEEDEVEHSFLATVIEINNISALIQPIAESTELSSSDLFAINTADLEPIDAHVGSIVRVIYKGEIMESYPAQINATSWSLSDELRDMEYTEEWLDKNTAEKHSDDSFDNIVITKIYSNCFFARTVIPMPYEIKINGTLSEEWCVGDQVSCTCENTYYDSTNNRMEADMLTIDVSDLQPGPVVCYKPVIYLYPKKETDVSVKLDIDGKLTCTYPSYKNGWSVTASSDGTLTDNNGQTYNYLYWEGETNAQYDFSRGFCIKGEDTAKFLEDALQKLGLNRKEANEFIVYWLPIMEQNPYNVISFQTDRYTDSARLEVNPTPDTLIRVFMAWQKSDSYVKIPEQTLSAPERNGFTVVEWGGSEIK